jgi:hypothetical protein
MAYRFTSGSSSRVQFGIGPFNGYTFGAFTIAAFFKRASTTDFESFVFFSNAAGGSNKLRLHGQPSSNGLKIDFGAEVHNYAVAADTTNWWLAVATCAGTGQPVRFHLHNGTSWVHGSQSSGAATLGTSAIGATDTLYVSAPLGWGGDYMNGDVVCAGVKKADSTDLAVETLSRTAFTAWTGFGFDWLAGFEAAGSPIVNRSNPGSGDETARTSVSLVSDPPSWLWVPALVPVAGFTATPLSGTVPLSVAFTDTSTNTPTSWAWDFGDGGTSTSQNPTHSYTASGVYTVSLTATNATGSNTLTRTAYISAGETIAYATGGGVSIW